MLGCAEEESAQRSQERGVPVSVQDVEPRTLRVTVRGIGSLRAREVVEVRPEIGARVTEVTFVEGDAVAEGDVLFRLDDRKLRKQEQAWEARLKAAQVRADNAERRLARFEPLAETKAVSGDERDQVETELEAARAQVRELEADLERIRENLEDATIRAAFTGRMSEHHVDVGDFVDVGEHLATLYGTGPLEVAFTVSERFMGRVREGQEVAVQVDAYPDETFAGEVHYVSPALAESTRNLTVKARIENTDGRLKPGAFASAIVTVETHADRPVVPERALVATRTGYIVYVVEDGTAHRRDVEIGVREPGIVEILDGVTVGQRVVSKGHMNLSDGVPVSLEAEGGEGRGGGVAS
jgi:membrane fusion protein (multidrug efflux system)